MRTPDGDASVFIDLLFAGLVGGWIYVNLVEDRGEAGGCPRTEPHWFRSPGALLDALPALREHADRCGFAIYIGVLPRRTQGDGSRFNVADGLVAWADVDFKKLPPDEARSRIRHLSDGGWKPTLFVHSGRGIHAYWRFNEPTDPATLERVCKKLAFALGSDAVGDPARVMRLPGTRNLKVCWSGGSYDGQPERAPWCRVLQANAERTYNDCDFDDLPDPPTTGVGGTRETHDRGQRIEGLPPHVQALLDGSAHLRELWSGEGKSAGDRTNSGYDVSFCMALVRRGIREPEVLDAAVRARPRTDRAPRDDRQVQRTVDRALATATLPPDSVTPDTVSALAAKLADHPGRLRILRRDLPEQPELRARFAAALHAPIVEGPTGRLATRLPCPACGAPSAFFFLDLAGNRPLRNARCHECAWSGHLLNLMGLS